MSGRSLVVGSWSELQCAKIMFCRLQKFCRLQMSTNCFVGYKCSVGYKCLQIVLLNMLTYQVD